MLRRCCVALGLLFGTAVLPGCNGGAPGGASAGSSAAGVAAPSVAAAAGAPAPRDPDAEAAVTKAVALLPTLPSRAAPTPGIVVADPVCAQATLAPFGRGCARWLHVALGGSPALGSTPNLNSVDRVRRELRRADLSLEAKDAGGLGERLGASHVLTSRLEGTDSAATLTLQWVKAGAAVPSGSPEVLKGPPAQIARDLPTAARKLLAALGGATPPTALTPSDAETLSAIGALWWADPVKEKTPEPPALAKATSTPLVELARMRWSTDGASRERVRTLLREAPENPLVWADIGARFPGALRESISDLTALRKRYPNNYALAHTEVWVRRVAGEDAEETAAARACVKDAPGDPDAWLALAWTVSQQAERVRRGKFAAEITAQEDRKINPLYTTWEQATIRAALLDREYAHAWTKVAEASTFVGSREVADAALWAGIKLDPANPDAYHWGFEMYQEKWGGDPAQLAALAKAVQTRDWPLGVDLAGILEELHGAGLDTDMVALAAKQAAKWQKEAKAHPQDGNAQYQWGIYAKWQKNAAEAQQHFREAVRLDPNNAAAHLELASNLDDAHRPADAIPEYRAAVLGLPNDADAHYQLGWALKETRKYSEARVELEKALALNPSMGVAHLGLAEVAMLLNDKKLAEDHYRLALKGNPPPREAYMALVNLLVPQKKYSEAIEYAQAAVARMPDDLAGLNTLAYALGSAGKNEESAEVCREILRRNPNDETATVNLGEALLQTGHKAEGKELLQKSLRSGNPAVVKEARDFLTKHP